MAQVTILCSLNELAICQSQSSGCFLAGQTAVTFVQFPLISSLFSAGVEQKPAISLFVDNLAKRTRNICPCVGGGGGHGSRFSYRLSWAPQQDMLGAKLQAGLEAFSARPPHATPVLGMGRGATQGKRRQREERDKECECECECVRVNLI